MPFRASYLCLPWLVVFLSAAGVASPQGVDNRQALSLDYVTWRHIGPASFGGRIDDIEAVASNPSIIFVGTASGGVFRSVNNGTTWRPVFDRDGTALSIGDIAIAPSDPNIVWVGTGEANSRQSSSWGDGVYKSVDGGETWSHMGLRDSQHIGRIAINPRNPDIVMVAATGHLWGPNEQRGVYRTKDGGKTWQKVLAVDNDTGAGDVVSDADGRTVFAAMYQRRRRAWGFVGGGPGSGLYRSLDGGDTWEKLSRGLPEGELGRIGLEIARSHPATVYAIVEHRTQGGVYRSDDRGATWKRQNALNPRPSYYSTIRVDPKNPDKVWVLGGVHVSLDGGKTFRSEHTADLVHVDHHALWIDPNNPDHLMLGNDGGLYFSYDGSRNWRFIDNLPIGQYYDIDVDGRDPYWIYGGTQDNGTWGVASRNSSLAGITNADVVNIAYGDGFYTSVDPKDHRVIYANSQSGRTYLVDLETREEKGIRPVPGNAKEEYRFNWSTPMLVSPHDGRVVYYGGHQLLKTANRGHKWEEISGDLTRNQDWKKLPVMGRERDANTLSRDDGVSAYGTITTMSESSLRSGLIYVGTDDGNLQVTRDGGKSWQNLTDRVKLPGPRWVSRVLASRHREDAAFATFDGHQDDDFRPYIFRTTDYGATWRSIAGDLPDGVVIRALAEHPRNPELLFVGTEFGLFVSVNGGRNWALVRGNLPRVRVDDIVINTTTNDVILGTHGRSIIVADDAVMLEAFTPAVQDADVHLFPVRRATQYYEMRMLPPPGAAKFSGPNPEYGALLTYYLKSEPQKGEAESGAKSEFSKGTLAGRDAGGTTSGETSAGKSNAAQTGPLGGDTAGAADSEPVVKIQILGPKGEVIRELRGPDRRGFNRVAWDLRYSLPFTPGDQNEGWFGPPKGVFVLPGVYTVKLTARGREVQETVNVVADPRVPTTPEALRARFVASRTLDELMRAFSEAIKAVESLEDERARVNNAVAAAGHAADGVAPAVARFVKDLDALREGFKVGWGGPKFSILDLLGQLQASTTAPTEAQLARVDQLFAEVTANVEKMNLLLTRDLPALHAQLAGDKISVAGAKPVALPKRPIT